MFVDDTNLACHGESPADIESKLSIDLDNVRKWLTANKLTTNKEKAEYIAIGSRPKLSQFPSNPCITIGNHTIQERCQKRKF